MKTPTEIFKEMSVGEQTASRWIKIIESAQKEAWNEAIEGAAESASLIEIGYVPQDTDSVCNDMGDVYGIDKQSILKLKQ